LGLSAAIAVLDVWLGLGLSYVVPSLPPSFAILAVATAGFVIVLAIPVVRRRLGDHETASGAVSRP
jgi:zinc/manganese transport system permease protein